MKKEKCENCESSFFMGAVIGSAIGFLIGSALVAILDFRDSRIEYQQKLRRDTDENYLYN